MISTLIVAMIRLTTNAEFSVKSGYCCALKYIRCTGVAHATAMIDESETIFVSSISIIKIAKQVSEVSGENDTASPTIVATPLPPRKPKNIGHI